MYHLLRNITRHARVLAAFAAFCPILHANVVRDWNECLSDLPLLRGNAFDPYTQARVFALLHVAIDRGVSAATRGERPVGDTARQRAAATTSAQIVLSALLPNEAPSLHALARSHLAEIPDGPEEEAGVALGRAAAQEILSEWVGHLPSTVGSSGGSVLPAAAGRDPRQALTEWVSAQPLVLRKPREVSATPLSWLDLSGEVVPVRALSRARIFDAVDRRELDQLAAAWSEPPILAWNRAARAASERAGQDLLTCAHSFSSLNLALADTVLATLHWQAEFGSWQREYRETAIVEVAPMAFNPALEGTTAGWSRAVMEIHLPPVRNFPALPAALAGAAESVLSRMMRLESGAFAWSAPETNGEAVAVYPSRHFKDYRSMAREAAFAASLDGQHSREACVSGYDLGVRIGQLVARRKPAPDRAAKAW